ncbi:hypothetical protein XENTR_v10024527 [Xenopus tropicalis]|nr:hypothetical protein XENTR_v10024527 [Xenopus tropicalis]
MQIQNKSYWFLGSLSYGTLRYKVSSYIWKSPFPWAMKVKNAKGGIALLPRILNAKVQVLLGTSSLSGPILFI